MSSGEHIPGRNHRRDGRLTAENRRPLAPLYKRLPHGPHQLDPSEVALNQRLRIHGAMIEAVARHGYERANVKQVITLAGVSRRSFYEQFPNKLDCFLATFDVLAARELQRARNAYLTAGGELEARLRAVIGARVDSAEEEPKAIRLCQLDALATGEVGLLRVCRAASVHEQLFGECFTSVPQGTAPPAPLLRALTGGIQGVIAASAATAQRSRPSSPEPLLEWALSFHAPACSGLDSWLARRLRERARVLALATASRARPDRTGTAAAGDSDDLRLAGRVGVTARRTPGSAHERVQPEVIRRLVLEATLRLGACHGHQELSCPQIADAARIPVEALLSHFATPAACTSAAHAMAVTQVESILADASLRGAGWALAVRPVLSALLEHLAARPLHARALVQSSFCLGEQTAAPGLELNARLATLLSPDTEAPARGSCNPPPLAGEAAVYALWHTVRCLLATRRSQLLPALTDHFSFLVLAPVLGAEPALALLRDG